MATEIDVEAEQRLMTEYWDSEIAENPANFVAFAYPWGKKGTPLEGMKGPRSWQREDLEELADQVKTNKALMAEDKSPIVWKKSTLSGRGVGKSALIAWMSDWMISCNIGSTVVVTANNEDQLKNRTWSELNKWRTMALNRNWFESTAMTIRPQDWFRQSVEDTLKTDCRYYYAQAQLWAEERPEAFAGIHNPLGLMVLFDEASGIASNIWPVTAGFFTEPVIHRYWMAFSNGRRTSGAFYETHCGIHPWPNRRQLDSRTVEGVDKNYLQTEFIEKYGADSDEARVEVYGQFPRLGEGQFIGRDLIVEAQQRQLLRDNDAALIMGIDVARLGNAKTVIRFRQGRDARSIPPIKLTGLDNMQTANRVAEIINYRKPDAVCVDAGQGFGVIDRLREMKYKVHEVWFGGKSDDPHYADKRTELWAQMRQWLEGACIDHDNELEVDLASPGEIRPPDKDYIKLESKADMHARGVKSPDDGDSLACTFAVKIPRRDSKLLRRRTDMAQDIDAPIFT